MIRDGHTLIGVGSEVAGGVRNISLHDCRVEGNILSSVAKIKTSDRKGAYIENIVVSNVVVSGTVGEIAGIYTDIDYQWGKYPPREHLMTTDFTIYNKLTSLSVLLCEANSWVRALGRG